METSNVALLRLLGLLAAGSIHAADAPRGSVLEASVGHVGSEAVARSGEGRRDQLVADIVVERSQPLRVGETVILHLE